MGSHQCSIFAENVQACREKKKEKKQMATHLKVFTFVYGIYYFCSIEEFKYFLLICLLLLLIKFAGFKINLTSQAIVSIKWWFIIFLFVFDKET